MSPPVDDLPVADPAVLLDPDDLAEIVRRLGRRIAADHPDGVVLVGVLKGALIFLSDLARAIPDIDVAIDFLAISRYAPDSGRVRILQDLALEVEGRDVVLVEDMVDTGLTVGYLLSHLEPRHARQVDVCTLLDRPSRRIVPLTPRYVGREIPDVFVLGYGLHHADLYRNVPYIVEIDRDRLVRQPDAYVDALYGGDAEPLISRRNRPADPVVG